ncbi:MAG: ribosome small subunit-dependent GTPase A [Lachnospiraceae bacterium]|nr:ribosome small subunit-dependent GTPase A [Lachnospiraceae bacterium]
MTGKIIKGIAGFYYVQIKGQGLYECKARGVFRKEGIKPLVGDIVDIEVISSEEMTGNVISVHDRTNTLIRPSVANVDQALIVFAAKNPKPNFNLLDRFLVMMEYQNLPVVICFNKTDLSSADYFDELEDVYSSAGYNLLFTSAKTGEGYKDLIGILDNKTTVVAGPSGVGKSSLINTLQSDVTMETGEISKKLGRGRHTTRHSEIIPIAGCNGNIIDTPGFSAINVPNIEKEDIGRCYPEFREPSGKCYFTGCSHINEPDCEVKRLVDDGHISGVRYDNYVKIYEELAERHR